MEKFIPYEKLSKKEKRKNDQARRQTWGDLNPVTRKPENSKAVSTEKSGLFCFIGCYCYNEYGVGAHGYLPKTENGQSSADRPTFISYHIGHFYVYSQFS